MKLYYYEFETSIFSPWEDCKYELFQGFLVETDLGIVRMEDDFLFDETLESVNKFEKDIKRLIPRNFQIVELK